MKDPTIRIPTDTEMLAAGMELGWISEGTERIPPRLRERLKKVVQEAWREGVSAQTHKVAGDTFSAPVLAIMTSLTNGDTAISESSAAHIVAAIAPAIWRDLNKGAAHS